MRISTESSDQAWGPQLKTTSLYIKPVLLLIFINFLKLNSPQSNVFIGTKAQDNFIKRPLSSLWLHNDRLLMSGVDESHLVAKFWLVCVCAVGCLQIQMDLQKKPINMTTGSQFLSLVFSV